MRKGKMALTLYEIETTINWNMLESELHIYTRMKPVMRHMEQKLGIKPDKIHKDKFGNVQGKEYTIPKSWLRLPQKPRQLSAETRKAMADRMSSLGKNRQQAKHK